MLRNSITQISKHLNEGVTSASELCELSLRRIEETSVLNAFISVTSELSREQAKAADDRIRKGKKLGPCDGIPFSVKDNFNTAGIRTTCASKMLMNFISPYNATVVQKLLDGGAVLVGKTNMDEFGMGMATNNSAFGPTKNIWGSKLSYSVSNAKNTRGGDTSMSNIGDDDEWYICGGSSGGSAVSVASGSCFFSLGSDTGGSVRNPAAYCGVVGLKPTYGLVSRHGLIPLNNSLDVPGIFSRTVDDAAMVLGLLSGRDVLDSTTVDDHIFKESLPEKPQVSNLTVGIPQEYYVDFLSEEIADAWRNVAEILENSGARVVPVSLPYSKYSLMCYRVLNCCELSSNMARYDGIEFGHRADSEDSMEELYAQTRHRGFSDIVKGRIFAGNYFLLRRHYDEYFNQAMKVRRLICQDFRKAFNDDRVDVLLTPVTNNLHLSGEHSMKADEIFRTLHDFQTLPVNMAGLPAVSVPVSLSSSGLPIGLQLIADNFQENKLLSVAKFIEQRVEFPTLELNS